jgi:hypothetical protein
MLANDLGLIAARMTIKSSLDRAACLMCYKDGGTHEGAGGGSGDCRVIE